MNQDFENLFQKYNLTCNILRKQRNKPETSRKSNEYQKNKCNILQSNQCSTKNILENFKTSTSGVKNTTTFLNFNSSCFLNTPAREKYCYATRYKTLDVKRLNCSLATENGMENNSGYLGLTFLDTMENDSDSQTRSEIICKMDQSFTQFRTCNNTQGISDDSKNIEDKRKALSCSFNIGSNKRRYRNRLQTQSLRYNKLNISVIPGRRKNVIYSTSFETQHDTNQPGEIANDSFNSLTSSPPKRTQIIDNPSLTQQPVENVTTELDLLIELIEREEKKNDESEIQKQTVGKFNGKDILPSKKSCLKGGLEELFERALKRETVRGNFLKHDRKIGLRSGKLLKIVDIETMYGVTIAVVKSEEFLKNVGIVVAQEMVPQLKIGTQVEAFFDDKTLPYKLQFQDDYLDIYLEPYKLLIV